MPGGGATTTIMLGQQVSHFYIIRLLGSGGNGVVYEAQDIRLPRSVALKFLSPGISADVDAVRRFKREARLAASLNHPNICTVLEVDEVNGRLFIVMEMLRGRTLKHALGQGPIDIPQALAIATQVIQALSAAHGQGIVHRDLSPANVFLTDDGPAKVLDFGLAKWLPASGDSDAHTSTLTRTGTVLGTVHYIAPERLDDPETADHRSDLYSVGVLLYEMLTGARPFEQQPRAALLRAIRHEAPVPANVLRAGLAPDIVALLARLLAKAPGERFADAATLLGALAAVRESLEGGRLRVAPRTAAPLLAVLPFEVSGEEGEFGRGLAAGLTVDVRRRLQARHDSRIASALTASVIRGLPLRDLGQRFAIDLAVEGQVQVADGVARLTLALADTRRDELVGAPIQVECMLGSLLATQDALADEACRRLEHAIAATVSVAADVPPEAMHALKRGLHKWRECFLGGWRQAIEHYQYAIDRAPAFAQAHVALANAYNFLGFYCLMKPALAFRVARQAAERAIATGDHLAAGHTELALARLGGDWDWEGAEASFRHALQHDVRDPAAHVHYSWLLTLLGRTEAARAEAREAQRLAPGSRLIAAARAQMHYLADEYDEVIAICDDCLMRDPDYPFALHLRGLSYLARGIAPRAVADLERVAHLTERAPFYLGLLGLCYGQFGMRQAALALVAELTARHGTLYVPPQCYVFIYAGLGERERALAYQEQAYADGASPFNYVTPVIRDLYALDPYHKTRLEQMRLRL